MKWLWSPTKSLSPEAILSTPVIKNANRTQHDLFVFMNIRNRCRHPLRQDRLQAHLPHHECPDDARTLAPSLPARQLDLFKQRRGGSRCTGLTPLGVVMAQKPAPKGRSMVASLMMGFAFGLGGMVSPLVGKLADIYSIETTLFYLSFVPILRHRAYPLFSQCRRDTKRGLIRSKATRHASEAAKNRTAAPLAEGRRL